MGCDNRRCSTGPGGIVRSCPEALRGRRDTGSLESDAWFRSYPWNDLSLGQTPDVDDACRGRRRRGWRSGSGCGASTAATAAAAASSEAADGALRERDAVIRDNHAIPVARTAFELRHSGAGSRVEDLDAAGLRVIREQQPARVERSVAARRILPRFLEHVIRTECPSCGSAA